MLAHHLARLMAAVPSPVKYRLAGLKPLYNRLLRLGSPVVTVRMAPGAVRWQIDQISSQAHLRGAYEPHMQRALQRWLRPGDTVYDVGAHAGFHTLFAALLVGPEGRVFAFEPHPYNAASLRRQAALNPRLAISVLALAASDRAGPAAMRVPGNTSQGALAPDGELPVAAATLDGLVAAGTIAPPALIKLDVEGHERAALRGAEATIGAHRPVILCDYNDAHTAALVRGALAGRGYRVAEGPPVTAVPEGRR